MYFFPSLIIALLAGLATATCPYGNVDRAAQLEAVHVHTRRQAIEGKKGIMYSRSSIQYLSPQYID